MTALHPPGVKDQKRMLQANHIANLANAKVIESFRSLCTKWNDWSKLCISPIYAYRCNPEDVLAAENAEELNCNWWLDVYCKGTYPAFALKYYERVRNSTSN